MKHRSGRPKRAMATAAGGLLVLASGSLLALAAGCGRSSAGLAPTPQATLQHQATPQQDSAAPSEPLMVAGDAPLDSSSPEPGFEVLRFDRPLPQAGGGLSIREAFEQNQAEVGRLSPILNAKNREVVARFGRNDTPEALQVLTPIRNRRQEARRNIEQMLCRDRPVSRARDALARRGIQFRRMQVDWRSVDAYVAAKIADGRLDAARAADLRFVLSKTGQGVMNPSSLGASTIIKRVAQALDCFGLIGRPRSPMRLAPPPKPPPPKPVVTSRLRFFRTCGDHVCRGYRGPVAGVPRCSGERVGSACSRQGARCDLGNNCNGQLVCAAKDPATRCAR